MNPASRLTLAALTAMTALPATAPAQRIDARVPGTTTSGTGVTQRDTPRPYSAPANPTVTRQASVGAVQSRIGSDGQIMTPPNAPADQSATPRRTKEPQLMQALAPATPVLSVAAKPASTPDQRAGEAASAAPPIAPAPMSRRRPRRR